VKKLLAAGALGLLLAGGTVVGASAAPNDHNAHGLCTAAKSGNKTGWKDGDLPGPFAGAPDGPDDGDAAGGLQDFIDAYCQGITPNGTRTGNPGNDRRPQQ
jgi:hypothetical protein